MWKLIYVLKGTTRNSYCIRGVGGGGTGGGKGRMERGIEGGRLTTLTVQFAALPLRNGTQGVQKYPKKQGQREERCAFTHSPFVRIYSRTHMSISRRERGTSPVAEKRGKVVSSEDGQSSNRLHVASSPLLSINIGSNGKKGGSAAAAFLNLPVHLAASAQVGQHRA